MTQKSCLKTTVDAANTAIENNMAKMDSTREVALMQMLYPAVVQQASMRHATTATAAAITDKPDIKRKSTLAFMHNKFRV